MGTQDGRIAALTDQNPAYFAAILLPAIVFTLNELLHGRWLVTSAAIALAGTIGIAISGTRGAWLSLAVVVIVFLLPRLDPLRRAAAVVVVLALVLITLQIPGIAAIVNERTDTALSSGGAGRTDIWTVGLSIIESAPVTGVGLANFAIANTPELLRASSVQTTDPNSLANLEAHNLVISTLGELGIVGFVLLAVFLVPLVVRRGWGPDADFVQAGLASLVIIAMFQDMLARKELWLLIGMAAGLAYLKKQQAVCEDAADPGRRSVASSGPTDVTDALWITRAYPWIEQPANGVFYQTQARAVARLGPSVVVASPTPWAPWPLSAFRPRWREYARSPRRSRDQNVAVIRPRYMNVPGEPTWARPDRVIADAMWRAHDDWAGARIIHGHYSVTGLAAWHLAGRASLPYVLTFHGSDINRWPDEHPERLSDLREAVAQRRRSLRREPGVGRTDPGGHRSPGDIFASGLGSSGDRRWGIAPIRGSGAVRITPGLPRRVVRW